MSDGGILAEEVTAGARVGDTKVGFGEGGSRVDGWAVGQGDSMGHFVNGFETKLSIRLRCCCYVWPGESSALGDPVLVGGGAAHGVLVSDGASVAFFGAGTGLTIVSVSNTILVRPAVANVVGALLLVSIVGAPTVFAMTLFGTKLVLEGLDLVGEVGVGGGEEGVGGNQLLEDSFIAGSGGGKIVKDVVDGVKEASGLVGVG